MADQKDLTINRVFEASIEDVWDAWTDPQKIKKWWGPKGVNSLVNAWEFRDGGNIDIVMVAGDELGDLKGQEWPMTGQFKEVDDSGHKLVFSAVAIMGGKPVLETLCTLTLEKQGNSTKVNLEIKVTKTTPEARGALSGMEIGWNQQIDKLAEMVN